MEGSADQLVQDLCSTIDVSGYSSVHFYDAAFSDLNRHTTSAAQTFARRYRERYHESVGDSGAADAYDAPQRRVKAIDLAYHTAHVHHG